MEDEVLDSISAALTARGVNNCRPPGYSYVSVREGSHELQLLTSRVEVAIIWFNEPRLEVTVTVYDDGASDDVNLCARTVIGLDDPDLIDKVMEALDEQP